MIKKLVVLGVVVILLSVVAAAAGIFYISNDLPKLASVNDYEPLLVSPVYDVKGKMMGEFFRERRILVPYEQMPKHLVQAFIAAEDSKFFEHGGIDFIAIARAMLTNIREGRKAQGASTITQQVARSLMGTREKSYLRKIREVVLSYRIEANLTKEEILYLYLNQIYFGQGANGVEAAANSYFRKSVKDLTIPEMAILAGLPKAPNDYAPTNFPAESKRRQRYVLERMAAENFISEEEAKVAANQPVTVYMREKYENYAPYFLETVRQFLVKELGEATVLDKGIKIQTTIDLDKQLAAQEQVQKGLRDLDKKQGFRGAKENISDPKKIAEFLEEQRDHLIDLKTPVRILTADGQLTPKEDWAEIRKKQANVPPYITFGEIVKGVVTKIDDNLGLVTVRFSEGQGLISIDTMSWARKPNSKSKLMGESISKPSQALKVGDVIEVKVVSDIFHSERLSKKLAAAKKPAKGVAPVTLKDVPQTEKYAALELEQEPAAEGALLSIDIGKQDIIAMVGGYDFKRNKFNRAIQAARQTGSSFKPIVYAAALDSGFTPATTVMDAPLVFQDAKINEMQKAENESGDGPKVWKPSNYTAKFSGDILFRNALIQSKNVPTVRILEKVSVDRAALYARRLGIFSPLNMDMSMGLGSSSVTLYEMTKAFGVFAHAGRRLRPRMIISVKSREGETLLENMSLDQRFEKELTALNKDIDEKRTKFLEEKKAGVLKVGLNQAHADGEPEKEKKDFRSSLFFDDPDQLISPQTAYLITTLLQGVIFDPNGTGGKARAIGRPLAGKTGTTSDYFDAWFMGYSPQIATGVWVGYDEQRSLGIGATGGEAALPIWVEYMKTALKDIPAEEFQAPDRIVFANIDNDTGKLASASSRRTVRQAFLEGTEPGQASQETTPQEEKDFLKEDLSQ